MLHTLFSTYIFAILMVLVPPEKVVQRPAYPGWAETVEQRTARYQAIADDIVTVAFDPNETSVEGGSSPLMRARTAALLATVAIKESRLALDVDKGPCYRGPKGLGERCDHGQSYTIWQLMVGNGRTAKGFTGPQLNADRKSAAREAMHRMAGSFRTCGRWGAKARLNIYASGNCGAGEEAGFAHLEFWRKTLKAYPPPKEELEPAAPVLLAVQAPAPTALFHVVPSARTTLLLAPVP